MHLSFNLRVPRFDDSYRRITVRTVNIPFVDTESKKLYRELTKTQRRLVEIETGVSTIKPETTSTTVQPVIQIDYAAAAQMFAELIAADLEQKIAKNMESMTNAFRTKRSLFGDIDFAQDEAPIVEEYVMARLLLPDTVFVDQQGTCYRPSGTVISRDTLQKIENFFYSEKGKFAVSKDFDSFTFESVPKTIKCTGQFLDVFDINVVTTTNSIKIVNSINGESRNCRLVCYLVPKEFTICDDETYSNLREQKVIKVTKVTNKERQTKVIGEGVRKTLLENIEETEKRIESLEITSIFQDISNNQFKKLITSNGWWLTCVTTIISLCMTVFTCWHLRRRALKAVARPVIERKHF